MYHVSQNKRTLDSAYKIESALDRLLSKDFFDRISVSEICKEAGVGRSTFYRLFDMPVDVIRWSCDENAKAQCEAVLSASEQVIASPVDFIFRYVFEHPRALEIAYKAGRSDILTDAFNRYHSDLLNKLRDTYHISKTDMEVGTLIVVSVITASFKHWIENDKKETVEVYLDRLHRMIHVLYPGHSAK